MIFVSLNGLPAHVQVARLDTALLSATPPATVAGPALGAWPATERLTGPRLKRVIALVLIAVGTKTAWGLL